MDILVASVAGFSIVVGVIVVAPTIKMAVDIAPFLYTNTRCAAKSGMIIDKKGYESLIASSSVKELFTLLEDTSYNYIVEHGEDFSTASSLLDKDLFETYDWLTGVMPDKIKPIIEAIKLKFEINQIKEAFNNSKEGKDMPKLKYINNPSLKLKLESANDFNSFTAAIEGSAYEDIFNGKGANNTSSINTALDRLYLEKVMNVIDSSDDKDAAKPFREYWRTMIDLSNIRLILRKISSDEESMKLIPGGTIDIEKLSPANDNNQVEEILQNTNYKDFISESTCFGIENAMFKFMKKQAGVFNAKYPLKGGPILQFIINKEIEIRNLNVIIKLKTEEFKQEDISKYVVV